MKKFTKLFITLAVCLGLSAMFTSCNAFFDLSFNMSSKIIVSDDCNQGDVYLDVAIYECDPDTNWCRLIQKEKDVYLYRGSSFTIHMIDRLEPYNTYKVVITPSNQDIDVEYQKGSASYSRRKANVFTATPGKNYECRLIDYSNYGPTYTFQLDEVDKF